MVGFEPETERNLTQVDYSIAGAVSGFLTRTLFQPLDVIKIRFQLQIEPIKISSPVSKYKGIIHSFKCIRKEEGIYALWKGHVPAQFLSVNYGALQFLSFEKLTSETWHLLPVNTSFYWKPVVNFTCGALAGCIATVGCQPFDVIRTRLVGQGEPKLYRGVYHAARTMVVTEGPKSLYKGLLPTLLQIAPNAGAQFAFYKLFKEFWDFVFKNPSAKSGILETSICGAAAGLASKTTVYPLDLIKKRIQVQGFEEARRKFGAVHQYHGFIHCMKTIVKEESIFGLYKGLTPSVWKAALTTGSHFMFYEQTCQILEYVNS